MEETKYYKIIIFMTLVLLCSHNGNAHDPKRNYGMDMLNGYDNTFWSVYSAGVFPLNRGYRTPRMYHNWFRGYNYRFRGHSASPYNWFNNYNPFPRTYPRRCQTPRMDVQEYESLKIRPLPKMRSSKPHKRIIYNPKCYIEIERRP